MPRGAQQAGRAGASIASANNTHGLWYNPAGLADMDRELLLDFTVPMMQAKFTRLQDGPTEDARQFDPSVDADSLYLPIPTLAYGEDFGRDDFGMAVGILFPVGVVPDWPETINVDGQDRPAPQRYSILSNDGTAYVTFALGAAYKPVEWLRFGAALYVNWGQFGARASVSLCEYVVCNQPEGREWEAQSQFLLDPFVTFSGVLGLTLDFDTVRIGLSGQLPSKVDGTARFDVALPDQPLFDDVVIDGETARLSSSLPTILRAGIDVAVMEGMRVELAGTYQNWSVQDKVVVLPEDIIVRNIPTLGDVTVQDVELPRNMRDTWSVHLGGSYQLSQYMPMGRQLEMTAGIMYERSAFDEKYLSPITLDADKVMLAIGFAVEIAEGWMLDASVGHLFMRDYKVRNSQVLLPSAVKPAPQDDDPSGGALEPGDRPSIANGNYQMEASFFGLGFRYLFGRGPRPGAKPNPVYQPRKERFGS